MRTKDILDHLEKFVALSVVAKSGSIRKAATILKISQPSLSVKIKNLEEALDIELFKRNRGGIQITESGRKAVRFVNDIILKAEELKLNFGHVGPLTGLVRIGIYDSIARYFWPAFYKHFSKKYPGIIITLSTGRSKNIEELLLKSELDIGIVVSPAKTKDMQSTQLFADSLSCYCTPRFATQLGLKEHNSKAIASTEAVRGVSLILFSRALIGNGIHLESIVDADTLDKFNIHRVENFETARVFCLEGIGLAILPNRVVHEEFKSKKLIKLSIKRTLGVDFGEHSIELACSKAAASRAVTETVIKEIKGYI